MFKLSSPKHILIRMGFIFTYPNVFIFLPLKVMDEQTAHPCEALHPPSDHDSTATDESKEEGKGDDTRELAAGKKTMMTPFGA